MDPPSDAAGALLDDLAALEDEAPWRLHLELLQHLVTTGADEQDTDDPDTDDPDADDPDAVTARLNPLAVHCDVPAGVRLVAQLVARSAPGRRGDLAHRCLDEARDATDRARAGTLVAVSAHLDSPEPAAVVAMGITSASARIASLLALGRDLDARREATGELRARVLALTADTAPPAPPWNAEETWWRALRIGGQAAGELSVEERAAAIDALVGIEDGAWHLLLVRSNPRLTSAMAWADRTGEGFLAAVGRQRGAEHSERFRELLAAMDDQARARTAEGLTGHLAGASIPGTTRAAAMSPPPGEPDPDDLFTGHEGTVSSGPSAARSPAGERRGVGWVRRLTRSLPTRLEQTRRGSPAEPVGEPPEEAAEVSGPVARERGQPDRRAGIVSTGFAGPDPPYEALDPSTCLLADAEYRFWLEIGPESATHSIDEQPVALPADLPARARLTVALSAYTGELGLRASATHGVLELAEGGTAVVVEQPGGGSVAPGDRRLRFPVTAPTTSGPARLRCGIYHRGVLVQSRVVTAEIVTEPGGPRVGRRALTSVVDYRLFRTLDAAPLGSLSEHRASLLLNADGAGTHGLRFVAMDGDDVITRDVAIGEGALGDQIRMARSALRRISWGNTEEWVEGSTYRYGSPLDQAAFTADLVTLASNGARFFQLLVEEVATAHPDASGLPDPYLARDRVAEVLRRPGKVQIALQRGPRHIVPAALVYDHWLTDSAATADYRLCDEYLAAVRDEVPLEQASCFLGDCPQAQPGADLTVVCPSGFWGFRHELGFPVTQGDAADATEVIAVHGGPAVSVGVSRELASAATHVAALRGLTGDRDGWRIAETRQEFLAGIASDDRHVVYLYCHGGVANNVPYVRLGEVGARPITRLDLANARVRWSTTRPLVFLNGCHTTALDPETAIDFVRFFVGAALASGVIGTEITIFEELGEAFGERFMQRFLVPGTTVGAAVRSARLDLLAAGNPLGLVYIPFALAGLQLGVVDPGR